ncbi:MAG: hypothetical protein FJW27_05020 [Acidimicrobiia bacterium]|nr:hypothetical protein [Acidimicrobiia bacterium]
MSSVSPAASLRSRAALGARESGGAAVVGLVLLAIALSAAISVDVVRSLYGVKGDESTYVAMTLSVAYDGDLSYQRRDLDRFWGLYKQGPEGIFLKKGKQFRLRVRGTPPFVRVFNSREDPRTDRLYFAKAMAYSIVAAPFVRIFGLNGFLIFHVLLLAVVCLCGYLFLRATSPPAASLAFVLAFFGVSVVPVYLVFLTPEIFNLALVFVAYFLWLYKAVANPVPRWLRGVGAEVAAAILLGIAAYMKPTNAPLAVPMVLALWWRRQWLRGLLVGTVFAAATSGFFLWNALITGEFNYQGGDRATFYERFPFDGSPQNAWDRRALVTTNDSDAAVVLDPAELATRFGLNVKYFLVGRHFGFIPYFFPGAVAIVLWARSRERFVAWRLLNLLGIAGSAVLLLLFLPYTWSGGGGPPGNRYFLSVYPALFFIVPPLTWAGSAVLAFVGGALFTAKMIVNPFVSAKFTWEATQRGFVRRLPVELTMANDLPVMLDTSLRGRIPYGADPQLILYFLDQHAFPPEPAGMWVAGDGRADIVVRCEDVIDRLTVTAYSPIHTTFSMSMGKETVTRVLQPKTPVTFDVPASGVRGLNSYAYLLTAISSSGFTPRLLDPTSRDHRNLAVLVTMQASRAARN